MRRWKRSHRRSPAGNTKVKRADVLWVIARSSSIGDMRSASGSIVPMMAAERTRAVFSRRAKGTVAAMWEIVKGIETRAADPRHIELRRCVLYAGRSKDRRRGHFKLKGSLRIWAVCPVYPMVDVRKLAKCANHLGSRLLRDASQGERRIRVGNGGGRAPFAGSLR